METRILLNRFEEYLTSHGLRTTDQRRLVLIAAVALAPDHFGVTEITNAIPERGRVLKPGRATIYRTLEHLVSAGILRKLQLDFGAAYYELVAGYVHHEHMICEKCGNVIEFECPDIERLQDEVCHRYGFEPRSHILRITGVCERCKS